MKNLYMLGGLLCMGASLMSLIVFDRTGSVFDLAEAAIMLIGGAMILRVAMGDRP